MAGNTKKLKPAICKVCKFEYKSDPVYMVDCPVCPAKAGSYCQRPSGHSGPFVAFHAERDVLALKLGFYDHPGQLPECGPRSNSKRAKEIIAQYKRVPSCIS